MKANEPIAWNIRRTVRRALVENALSEPIVNVRLDPQDWDGLLAELGDRLRWDIAIDPFDGAFVVMHSSGRAVRVFCNPKQAPDTVDIALTADVAPEVFA